MWKYRVSEVSCYVRCGGDYRMPETGSALFGDLPLNHLTGRGVGEERVFWDGSRISVSSFG